MGWWRGQRFKIRRREPFQKVLERGCRQKKRGDTERERGRGYRDSETEGESERVSSLPGLSGCGVGVADGEQMFF